MANFHAGSFTRPDDVMGFPGVSAQLVELGDITVARLVHEPGWQWSKDMKPVVGGDWCEARHIGVVLSGTLGIGFSDGTTIECGPDTVYDVPPGHDGWVVGPESLVLLEWAGVHAFGRHRSGSRILTTLLFTDLVDSTTLAGRLGDAAWRELLSGHYRDARAQIERYRGREVKTTGDGLLAMFDGTAFAVRCAAGIVGSARRSGLHVRAGVHVGEVELVGDDIRGVAVHEAARIMAAAWPGEVLVSQTTFALSAAPDVIFEDRGLHELKGLDGARRLYAYRSS